MMKRILIFVLLLPLPLYAAETGYKVVHPDGTVEFTDDPRSGGEAIELKEAPTFDSLPAPRYRPASDAKKDQRQAHYKSIGISSPKPEQTFWFDGTGINFTVDIQPSLASGDTLVIELDGKDVARGRQNSFIVNGIFRGEHHVTAKVVDAKGKTLLQSTPVTFYMQRHTVKPSP